MSILSLWAAARRPSAVFPADLLRELAARRSEVTPLLVDELRRAAGGPPAPGARDYGLVLAVYLLAEARDPAAYPLLLRLAALPGDAPTDLLGDVVTEDLGRILAAVSRGNIGPMQELIGDPRVNVWVRSACLDGLLAMFVEQELPRETLVEYLRELLCCGLEPRPSFVWEEVAHIAKLIHPGELMPELDSARERGLLDPVEHGPESFDEFLSLSPEALTARTRATEPGYIRDAAELLARWYWPDAAEALDEAISALPSRLQIPTDRQHDGAPAAEG